MKISTRKLSFQIVFPVVVMMLILMAGTATVVPSLVYNNVRDSVLETSLRTLAQIKTMRGYYTNNVVKKIKAGSNLKSSYDHAGDPGKIPLPATMIHDLSQLLEEEVGVSLKLYSAFPFPNRQDRQLEAFQQEAWDTLSLRPNEVVSVETLVGDRTVMRVAVADVMEIQTCIDCHNTHPNSPKKDWKLGDVRGVLEVNTDITNQLALADTLSNAIAAGIAGAGIVLIGVFIWLTRRVTNSIGSMTMAMSRLGEGDYSVEVGSDLHIPEIAQMGKTVDNFRTALLERRKAEDELKKSHFMLEAKVEERTAELRNENDERMRTEEALKASEYRHRIVLDSALDGIVTIDDAGKIVEFNPAAEDIFGLRSDDVIGNDIVETIIPPDLRDQHRIGFKRYLDTGKHNILGQRLEITAIRSGGEIFPIELTVTPFSVDGRQYFAGFLRDITERKRTEESLQDSLAWLEEAQRIGQVGHWVWDEIENREMFQSQATIDIMGYKDIPTMPSWDDFLEIIHPEDREHVERIQVGAVQSGTSYECEYRIIHPDGDTRVIIERGEPVFDDAGRIIKTVGTVMDITNQKIAEDALQAALAEAERASLAKSEFLAHVSHELRTPLNAITGFSQIMTNEIFGKHVHPKYLEYAHDVLDSGHHLLSVINDILDLSKVEAGEITLNPSSFLLHDAIKDCIALIKAQSSAHAERIHMECSDQISHLYADKRVFRQILLNLLANADRFTPDDGRITIKSKLGDEGRTLIQISDTGIGIASENLSRVLEPFGQVRDDAQITHEGTGLGLPLSQKLMELHGGTLAIQSEFNVGTTVTISFPNGVAPNKATEVN